jgi:hypothetical protein
MTGTAIVAKVMEAFGKLTGRPPAAWRPAATRRFPTSGARPARLGLAYADLAATRRG